MDFIIFITQPIYPRLITKTNYDHWAPALIVDKQAYALKDVIQLFFTILRHKIVQDN